MRYTSGGALAAFAICLVGAQAAQAEVINDQNDARAFAIRESEIAREKTAAESGTAPAKSEIAAKPAVDTAESDKAASRAGRVPAAPDGLKAIVARHAAANGVPFSLADAIVRVESRYNPRAAHAGNFGLMQIRHQTARGVGYSGSAAGLLDAETNARFGMKYLAQAYKLAGGDTCRTIMKYQGGHLATRMSGANRIYCAKVHTITARS